MAAVSSFASRPLLWHKVLVLTLAFWLSSSLFLDLIMMPSLYAAGMMTQPDFATAGYGLFWLFNRLQLVLGAIAFTGLLAQHFSGESQKISRVFLAAFMFLAVLICTYLLAPQMSVLGLDLNLFEKAEIPTAMDQLHYGYWLIEAAKLAAGGVLLNWSIDRLTQS
jgi:Domain of unknown function (DUF4149)